MFSSLSLVLGSVGADRSARLWDLATGSPLSAPLKHDGPVRAVVFHPDGNGVASYTHRYILPGSYTVVLGIRDDDGGSGAASAVVRVVTPQNAIEEIISQLDAAIAAAADKNVRDALEKARKALAGSNDHSNDGALSKIKAGNQQAAIAAIQQAIDWLQKAQAAGANVAAQITALEQVVAALSAT